ncbi:GTP cyclohydrolase 1 type 2/Nif3 [Zopfochytrium polystomum]|nr:GTP cyclohydrolase 1 type 2/Nif3 [Zopfochytrium polystomum]
MTTKTAPTTSLARRTLAAIDALFPLSLAETSWDNVGLLIEPFPADSAASIVPPPTTSTQQQLPTPQSPGRRRRHLVFLANDLSAPVLTEALALAPRYASSAIVAYHPPLFRPFKRMTPADPAQAVALRCAAAAVAVLSPHTAADAAWGGVNDWLARGVVGLSGGGDRGTVGFDELKEWASRSATVRAVTVAPAVKAGAVVGQEGAGAGRVVEMDAPVGLDEVVGRVKAWLGLEHVRVSLPFTAARLSDVTVRSVGICAGSGASVLAGLAGSVDVFLTGEMSHHEVLAAAAAGTAVVLCEHSNTERGYLAGVLRGKLEALMNGVVGGGNTGGDGDGGESGGVVEVVVSKVDRDPLFVV